MLYGPVVVVVLATGVDVDDGVVVRLALTGGSDALLLMEFVGAAEAVLLG